MIAFDRADCRDGGLARTREWLVTNSIGGYAFGTLSVPTRRYHAVLTAAVQVPNDRRVCVARLEEAVLSPGQAVRLDRQQYKDGAEAPSGPPVLQRFWLEYGLPVWEYAAEQLVVERRLWMPREVNATVIEYRFDAVPSHTTLELTPLLAWRSHHALQQASGELWTQVPGRDAVSVEVAPGKAIHLYVAGAAYAEDPAWHYQFWLGEEVARGFDGSEDLFRPGRFAVPVTAGSTVRLVCAFEDADRPHVMANWTREAEVERRRQLVKQASADDDELFKQLVLAADQFVVQRAAGVPSVLAGYPWFTDWGRDTMIALPGLLLATGRTEECRQVLMAWAGYQLNGLLPNRFPDEGEAPQHGAADASLWMIHAAAEYARETGDNEFVDRLFPVLGRVIDHYLLGTEFGISVDRRDGLLRAGIAGQQVTWMDAKVGDLVVTPRIGKPVELNALWYNALSTLANWAVQLGKPSDVYVHAAEVCAKAFNERFWYKSGGYLFDVVDGPDGDDLALRPNQLLALSLPYKVLEQDRWRSVLDVVSRELLTPMGLRTLAPSSPSYRPVYAGDGLTRDTAYHQGTVWPWLLGAYGRAHYACFGDLNAIRALLKPLVSHLSEAGAGSISEVFDGAWPHKPGGCIAQAWSVAAVITLHQLAHSGESRRTTTSSTAAD